MAVLAGQRSRELRLRIKTGKNDLRSEALSASSRASGPSLGHVGRQPLSSHGDSGLPRVLGERVHTAGGGTRRGPNADENCRHLPRDLGHIFHPLARDSLERRLSRRVTLGMGINKLEQPVTDAGWTVGTMLTRGTSDRTDTWATAACTAAAGGHRTAGRQLLPARLPFWFTETALCRQVLRPTLRPHPSAHCEPAGWCCYSPLAARERTEA